MRGNTVSVDRVIPAPPAKIFELLADAGLHNAFDGSGTVVGTKAESRPLSKGSRFGMSMKMGLPYKTANEVVEFEQDRRIAWQTSGFGGLVGGRIWRYELEPVDGGTLVRETWDLSDDRQRFLLRRSHFPAKTRQDMARTLERLEQAVAQR
jgi:uncharacterized protein YndB with AHSA1/START domain